MLPTGALAFTLAHAEGGAEANNGTTTGFTYANNTIGGGLGMFSFTGLGAQGFVSVTHVGLMREMLTPNV